MMINKERLGSQEFWTITNRVTNRGKSLTSIIINGFEVSSSSPDKAKNFSMNFDSNFTHDVFDHPHSDFSFSYKLLTNFSVTVKEFSNVIYNLESGKATTQATSY